VAIVDSDLDKAVKMDDMICDAGRSDVALYSLGAKETETVIS